MKGKFVMVDGLDGSGKGVAVNSLKEWALKQNMKVLDLREYWKTNEGFPDINDYDAIISAEPTFTGTGKIIREQLIKNGSKATGKEVADAFSKDRKELYEKIILPARKAGKFIFQERGVITSIVYQPLMENSYTLEEIKNLEGNKFCLNHAPDLLIITVVNPEVVIERLKTRKKEDDAIFEQLEFQKKIKSIYESDWLKELFESKGSKIVFLDTNPPSTVEDTKKKIIEILEQSMSSS